MDTAIQGVLSHTRLLPCELLTEIFLHYRKVAEHSYPIPKLPAPLLLGQICSTWRHVVHGTPKLWTKFLLQIRNKVEGGRVDHVSFAKAWLSRAHPHPLHVYLLIETLIALIVLSMPSYRSQTAYRSLIYVFRSRIFSLLLMLGPWHY
jgi:hypothetical protein